MIAIIDYNAGNTQSLMNALQRLGIKFELTNDPDKVYKASKIIFPGQGHARQSMDNLKKTGLIELLKTAKQPFLGVCVGMQLLYSMSDEGDTSCLAIVPQTIKLFQKSKQFKVPHIGWNSVKMDDNPLFKSIPPDSYYYFVHSYYAPISNNTIGICDYTLSFSAAIQKDNYFGVQFHPEKSGNVGEKLLKNFVDL